MNKKREKSRQFFREKNRVTPSVAERGDTSLSDAIVCVTDSWRNLLKISLLLTIIIRAKPPKYKNTEQVDQINRSVIFLTVQCCQCQINMIQ